MKRIIINADDFGYSEENNEAIKLGYEAGIITSSSILTNTKGFEQAKNEILPQIPNIDLGFHFNIIEGKSITNPSLLCDNNGFFNNSYLQLINKSKDSNFKLQIENEFRAQIEKILPFHSISHIDSHVHTHAIPEIFKIVVNLADEYNIKYVRTQKEIPYITLKESINSKFPINIVKNILLNYFTYTNTKFLQKRNINTNDYFVGVLYTGMMTEKTIIDGLRKNRKDNSLTEVIFHPTTDTQRNNNYIEFKTTQNPNFKKELENLGFMLTKYSEN